MDKIPHILHVSTPNSWRGGEQQMYYLVEELKSKKCSQVVLCRKGSVVDKRMKALGVQTIGFVKKTSVDVHTGFKIKQVCKRYNINVIHVHDAHAHTFAFLAASMFGNKVPIVVSRRVDFPIKDTWMSKLKYNHPNIKKILCVSDAIKEITGKDIQNKSVLHTVYSGIDPARFPYQKEDCNTLHQMYGWSRSIKIVGNASALAPHKDYYTFIRVAEKLLKTKSDIRFVIVGSGPLEGDLKIFVHELGLNDQIKFTGFREDVPKVLPEFDVMLITSETEGLGTTIIDAFACNVPVVGTNAGGIPELIEDQKTGLLREVRAIDDLAEAVVELLDHPTIGEKLSQGAKIKLKDFLKANTASQTFLHYQDLLSA